MTFGCATLCAAMGEVEMGKAEGGSSRGVLAPHLLSGVAGLAGGLEAVADCCSSCAATVASGCSCGVPSVSQAYAWDSKRYVVCEMLCTCTWYGSAVQGRVVSVKGRR